jgi:V/A-type H+-transporting ATPase subunit C
MRDSDYIFAVARIRVLERGLLNDDDIKQMCSMKDAKSVVSYLEDHGWGDGSGQLDADQLLAYEQNKTLKLMHDLRVDQAVFDVLTMPRYYHNLKCIIKEICAGNKVPTAFYELPNFGHDVLYKAFTDQNLGVLPEKMRKPAQHAFDIMSQTGNGQWCDVILDKACLVDMLDAAKSSKSQVLIDYCEANVSSSDIKIAVRCARTGKDLHFVEQALAPCRDVSAGRLAQAAVHGEEDLLKYLESSSLKDAAEALRVSNSEFERWCDNRLIQALRSQKTNITSVGPVVAYYLARENEARNVRIIVTAKTNGFSEQQTLERMREMYG